jgi:hypothetical protein
MRLAGGDAAAAQTRLGDLAHDAVGAHLAMQGPGFLPPKGDGDGDVVLQVAADTGQRHARRDPLDAQGHRVADAR